MKKLIAILLCASLIFAFAGCAVGTTPETTVSNKNDAPETLKIIKVLIVHEGGAEKELRFKTDKEFLGPLLEEEGVIKGNEGPYGLEITEVDGVKAVYSEDKAYWALYEGEEYALQGIDTTPIVDGTTYKLVYTPA